MATDCLTQHCITAHDWKVYPCPYDYCKFEAYSPRSYKENIKKILHVTKNIVCGTDWGCLWIQHVSTKTLGTVSEYVERRTHPLTSRPKVAKVARLNTLAIAETAENDSIGLLPWKFT